MNINVNGIPYKFTILSYSYMYFDAFRSVVVDKIYLCKTVKHN